MKGMLRKNSAEVRFPINSVKENNTDDRYFTERILGVPHPNGVVKNSDSATEVFETVVISDLHLGSRVTQDIYLEHFLETVRFKRIILNGDIFDSMNMKRLTPGHWKILGKLRSLERSEHKVEVIWVRGNHDGYIDTISSLLGVQFVEEYLFRWNDLNILVFHGDVFDKYITQYPFIADIADYLYRSIIYLDYSTKKIGRWLKRNSKTFIRNTERVREGAIQLAKHRHADVVICGHTHHAEDVTIENIRYLNTGSWTDFPLHFVGFTENNIELIQYMGY